MSANQKPRADSKLKTLPEDRQAAIAEYARSHSLSDVVTWLRADGLATSSAALSVFLSWWGLQQQFKQDDATTESLLEELKREIPGLTEQQLDELGQRTFSLLSIRNQDLEGFVSIRSARAKAELEKAKLELRQQAETRLGEGLKLQQQKFQRETCNLFLQWAEDQRVKQITTGNASNSDKIEQLGQLMFGEDWKPAS